VARALLVQCVLSAATLLLFAELARSLFDSRRAGVAAALMGAVFLPYASMASQLLSETLFIFLIAAALLAFEAARRRGLPWRWLLAGGLLWGLATLTRPVGLYALPLLLLWALLGARRSSGAGWHSFDMRPALALLLGVVLVVAPWTARNYAVHGHLILVDTNGGTSFWLGNLLEPDERELQFVWNRTIPNLAEREDAAVARALANIQREPLTFLARTRNKAVALWQFDTRLFIANAPIGITLDERSLAFALASDAQYVVLLLLALLGVVAMRGSERNLPLLGWPLYGTLLSAISLGHPRLRLPLLIAMFAYAALPLAHPRLVWERLRAQPWRRWLLLLGVLALALLWYARVYGPFLQSQFWIAQSYLTDDTADVERAITAMPTNYLPYVRLGDLWRSQGDAIGALVAYSDASIRAPQNTYVHTQQLDLHRRTNNPAGVRAEMAAIAAVGWDNNQLYDWAWDAIPATTGARLDIDAPAPGLMRGVYAPQQTPDGRAFRWTHARAQIRFEQPGATRLRLLLRAPRPATPVQVHYQGEWLTTLDVGTEWRSYSVELPPPPPGLSPSIDAQIVELRVPTVVRSTEQPYPRGVALAEAWLATAGPEEP
jgi:hypothetical protein